MKKLISLLLICCILIQFPIQAHAASEFTPYNQGTYGSVFEPETPAGFTYWYTTTGNAETAYAWSNNIMNIFLSIAGYVGSAISIVIGSVNEDTSTIPGTYIRQVYVCDDPISWGVPYVYWHKIKYTVYFDANSDGIEEPYTRWTSYYEYAVAPR